MRKLKFLFALLPLMLFTACSSAGSGPEVVAEKFIKAVLSADFESAKALCTEETKPTIDLIVAFTAGKTDELKKSTIKIEKKDVTISEDGNSADVVLLVSGGYDLQKGKIMESEEEKVHLVKVDNKWLVENKLK